MNDRNPVRVKNGSQKRFYEIVLICPIAQIRLIWGYFETEPDTGFFLGCQTPIGGHIGAGLGVPSHYGSWDSRPGDQDD